MAQIVPKLNLNKTPSLVESNSLIFAKNIRIDVDSTIHRDYGILPLSFEKDNNGNYSDYGNIIKRIINDIKSQIKDDTKDFYTSIYNNLTYISNDTTLDENNVIITSEGNYGIVGIIPDSNDFYIFIHGTYKDVNSKIIIVNCIIKYDEHNKLFTPCNCNWNWSGGKITGYVVNNLIGDKIINIGESAEDKLIPLKSINLTTSNINQNEDIYTQIPYIPITNLNYGGSFSYSIPNGVYQFFVRYRISKDFYTDWFPASNELFAGNKNSIVTSFGTVLYTNTHRDSDNSFILNVEHLIDKNKSNYNDYQIGFILSHDDVIYARAWKHFNFDIEHINFDYNANDSEEIEVIDLLKVTYGLYNVGNITAFKNKLYISNYTESNFNEDLQIYADKVKVLLKNKSNNNTYAENEIITTIINGEEAASGLKKNNVTSYFNGTNGIFHSIMNCDVDAGSINIHNHITNLINNIDDKSKPVVKKVKDIDILYKADNIKTAQDRVKEKYKDVTNNRGHITYTITFADDAINKFTVNDKEIENVSDAEGNSGADKVLPYVYSINRYLNSDCNWINSLGIISDKVIINIYRTAHITKTETSYGTGIIPGQTTSEQFEYEYIQTITLQYIADKKLYNNTSSITKYTTLIPYQKYKFYIHFVKSTGEITNGYYCSNVGEIEVPYYSTAQSIYPKFSNIIIPNGYVSCFLSICHTKVNSSTVFNIKESIEKDKLESTCLDINMMLYQIKDKIHIKQGTKLITSDTPTINNQSSIEADTNVNVDPNIPIDPTIPIIPVDPDDNTTKLIEIETSDAKYYDSSDSSSSKYFGADGIIAIKIETGSNSNLEVDKLAYAISDYSISETDNIELIKCTPYINKTNATNSTIKNGVEYLVFDDYYKLNLLGYICNVAPLLRDVCIRYYSDGSSVYYKDYNTDDGSEIRINLTELIKYEDNDDTKLLKNFGLKVSNTINIYSNYNLNYVTLSEEPTMSIKTWYNRPPNDTGIATEKQSSSGNTIILRLFPSQLMSTIYSLPSMYKSYTRKTYSIYDKLNNNIIFNNTIRSSVLYGDENRINLISFDANDYYNIPTNRGIIVNLTSIGDGILAHTKDSIFRFSGSNTLQSSNGEIQTSESKPFDTGVTEVFGSDFGFAGLQNKSDYIVTELGYIFFDRDSRIVYLYSGQGQIAKISDSIEKLFRHREISNISFANDYYNNRFFMSIMFYENSISKEDNQTIVKTFYPVTLSFNILSNIKSFVSLHDFYYNKSFNTKTNCYFLTNDNRDICTINKEQKGLYEKLSLNIDNIYPSSSEIINLNIIDKSNSDNSITNKHYTSFNSIIDIIVNDNYENIKTLNAILWSGTKIEKEFQNIDYSNEKTLCIAEDINYDIPCKYIRIYTNSCMTPLCNCTQRSNDKSISAIDYYKYPFYNQGMWNFNYFRNILNSKGHIIEPNYSSDNNSLIEGKYFVVRFIFDSDFKFENLSLNYSYKNV